MLDELARCCRRDPEDLRLRWLTIRARLRLGFQPEAAEAWLLASPLFVDEHAWILEACWTEESYQSRSEEKPWWVWTYARRPSLTWDDRLRIEWTPQRGIRFNTWNSGDLLRRQTDQLQDELYDPWAAWLFD